MQIFPQHFSFANKTSIRNIIILSILISAIPLVVFFSQKQQDIRQRAAELCIPSGDETAINAKLQGAGAKAILCQNAIFRLNRPIWFTSPNQEISTQGLPTDQARALFIVDNPKLAYAINGQNLSGVAIKNIRINGNRTGLGRLQRSAEEEQQCINSSPDDQKLFCPTWGLVIIGGNASGQTVNYTELTDPRSWTALQIYHGDFNQQIGRFGCSNATITNNSIGPAGWPNAEWADGISITCDNSVVSNNTITDITDAGIAILGSQNTRIENNTIKAITHPMLGGIAMIDNKIGSDYNGHYDNTTISNNTIIAQSAMVKVGIAMGYGSWHIGVCDEVPPEGFNTGAIITNNKLQGAYFGYGYLANGVKNWTVTGNTSQATHRGDVSSSTCAGKPLPPPAAFIKQENSSQGTFQSEFQNASFPGQILRISDLSSKWIPPHCDGGKFAGCTTIEGWTCTNACTANTNPVCSDKGNTTLSNWTQQFGDICNTACGLPDPNAFCLAQAPTETPTPTVIPPTETPALSPTITPTITNTPTPTLQPSPSATPTITETPTPTPNIPKTRVSFAFTLSGIEKSRTNIPAKNIQLNISNTNNQEVLKTFGIFTYNSTDGIYKGTVDLETIPTGEYIIKIKPDNYLQKLIPGLITIIDKQTTTIPQFSLTAGDVNNDNILDSKDWNILVSCYSDLTPARSCNEQKKQNTDLNEDNKVDMIDITIFLRGLAVRSGD